MNNCIEEQSIEPYFSELLSPLDCASAYPLESFSVKQENREICSELINGKNPFSILFYGKPGAGKTELSKSLCKNAGQKTYVFKNEVESENRSDLLARLVCLLSMERTDSIIVVDEADSILKSIDFSFFGKTPSKNKGTINKMLENNKNKVIYIINHRNQIDDSTLRRFSFSIRFEAMSQKMLSSIAKSKLLPLNLSQSLTDEILSLLSQFHITGSSVDNVVKVIEGLKFKDETTLLKKAKAVIKENCMLLNGAKKIRETVKSEYELKVLNTSTEPEKIVEMVQNAVMFSEKSKESENGIRMLFYGLSGTGKTEFARYIAQKLGKPILLKRASDIFGMYVGENEKNIRNAFDEAEETDSILLFDEADSFFYDRETCREVGKEAL